MRRRHLDPGLSSGRGRREKGGPEEPADHALGRSRGGWGTKLHLVCDERGLPLGFSLSAGQVNECQVFESLVSGVRAAGVLGPPRMLAGDKAYSSWPILRWLRRRRIRPVIPRRADQRARRYRAPLCKRLYRKRNVIERLVGWLKHRRRLATRFEKFATAFAPMIRLAFVEIYLAVLL